MRLNLSACTSPRVDPRVFTNTDSPPDTETELNVALLPRHPRALPPQTGPTPIPTNPAPNHLLLQRNYCSLPFLNRIILPIQTNASTEFGRCGAWTTTMEYPRILVLWTYIYGCVSNDGVLCR